MRQWQSNHQQDGYLLREAPLIEAETWRQQREDISPSEIEYIQASLELRDREKLEKLQTQMALEAAKIANQKLQDANRRANRRIIQGIVISLLTVISAGIWSILQKDCQKDILFNENTDLLPDRGQPEVTKDTGDTGRK